MATAESNAPIRLVACDVCGIHRVPVLAQHAESFVSCDACTDDLASARDISLADTGEFPIVRLTAGYGPFDAVCTECASDLATTPTFDNRRNALDGPQCRGCGGADGINPKTVDARVVDRNRGAE